MIILEIINSKHPKLLLKFSNGENKELDMEAFLNQIAPDNSNPYRKILEPKIFKKAYVQEGKLIWDEVLEIVMCGGDTMWTPIEFSSEEVLIFFEINSYIKRSSAIFKTDI